MLETFDTPFDIVIIGSGPGGYSTALRAAELGKSVAIVEKDTVLGGTCLNRGCIPTKALIVATRELEAIPHAAMYGIHAHVDELDYEALRTFKDNTVATMTKGLTGLLAYRKVHIMHGEAELLSLEHADATDTLSDATSHTVHDAGEADSTRDTSELRHVRVYDVEDHTVFTDIAARDVVIATGSRPRPLPQAAFGSNIIDSDRALTLEHIPSKAIIVGSGAIAIEFASIWQAAGSEVTLVIRHERVLTSWDRRTAMMMTRELKKRGINVLTKRHVSSATSTDAGVHVSLEEGDELDADLMLVAIGRTPNTDTAWIGHNNIALKPQANHVIDTDPWGRTSVPHVWAVGDVTDGFALAHKAYHQGMVLAEAIAGLNPEPVDLRNVPQAVFSNPEGASVGLTLAQAQADEHIINPQETIYPMLSNARMVISGENGSLVVVTGAYDDAPDMPVVLGAHSVSPEASALITTAQQLIGNRVPLAKASSLLPIHPTMNETFSEALLKADGRPLHTR